MLSEIKSEPWAVPSCSASLFPECMDCGCKPNVHTLLHGLQKFLSERKVVLTFTLAIPLPPSPHHVKSFVTNWEMACTQWAASGLSAGGFYWELTGQLGKCSEACINLLEPGMGPCVQQNSSDLSLCMPS